MGISTAIEATHNTLTRKKNEKMKKVNIIALMAGLDYSRLSGGANILFFDESPSI